MVIERPENEGKYPPLIEQAKKAVIETQQGSISIIQRKLRIGYSRAAELINELESMGIVGPFRGSMAREVLVSTYTPHIDSPDG